MSLKNTTQVIIDGKIYTLCGYESEDYLKKVASYINSKIAEFKKEEVYRRQNIDTQRALLDLNIADDYFKARKQAELLESDLDDKDQQLYDIKHELISTQIKLDSSSKDLSVMQSEMSVMQNEIIRLENELKEYKKSEAEPE